MRVCFYVIGCCLFRYAYCLLPLFVFFLSGFVVYACLCFCFLYWLLSVSLRFFACFRSFVFRARLCFMVDVIASLLALLCFGLLYVLIRFLVIPFSCCVMWCCCRLFRFVSVWRCVSFFVRYVSLFGMFLCLSVGWLVGWLACCVFVVVAAFFRLLVGF